MSLKKILLLFSLALLLNPAGFGSEYPKIVNIECGKIKIELSKHTYWNINRLWYEGYLIGEPSGFWGTVFAIPSMGLVGSGHLSKKGVGEDVKSLKLFADGKYVSPEQAAKAAIECKEFSLQKTAKVSNITFNYTATVKNDKLYESCKLQTSKDQKLALMYNFMHPWNRRLTNYYVQVNKDKAKEGMFKADSGFPYEGSAQWLTFYDMVNNIGVVSKYSGDPAIIRIWDRTGNKKIYLQAFKNETMEAGKTYSYGAETDFYRASPADWKVKAGSIMGSKVIKTAMVPEPKAEKKVNL